MTTQEEVKQQFFEIFSSFFGDSENEKEENSEVVIKEWARIFYVSHNEWKDKEINFDITDESITAFQQLIIQEKFRWEEKLEKDFYEKLQEKGHVNYSYVFNEIPLRINWSIGMWKSFMRIRKLPSKMYTPDEIWVPKIIREEVRKYKEWWLIVVWARPGSWKSTTIASVLQELLQEKTLNVVTLEDPIEYIYLKNTKSIVQQREKIFDFDEFSTGIESCMTQYPDVVVVQEMRNREVIRQVMELVEKGVLVITTVHTSDAPSIFESILWAFDVSRRKEILDKLSVLFKCFIAQKLIKRKEGEWKVAVFEVLVNSPEVKWYLADDKVGHLHQVMARKPHILMSDAIINMVEDEVISLKDWRDACPTSRKWDLEDKIGG